MATQFARPVTFDEAQYRQEQTLKNRRFGLQLWRLANGIVFVFFIFANYLMRSVQATWPPEGIARADALIPTLFTIAMLVSWLPTRLTQASIRKDDHVALVRNIATVIGLGILFLIGVGLMWRQLTPGNAYSSIYYAMLGFHAVHVLVGIVLFGVVWSQHINYSKEGYWGIEAASVFWQFVVLMWIFFYLVLYII